MTGDAFQEQPQFFHAEGLGDVVVGAILHRLHGGLHGAVSSHDDDQRLGAVLSDVM